MKNKLKTFLTQTRYIHSINVSECAKKMAKIYDVDEEKAYIASILHDCAKCLNHEQMAYYLNKYNIELDEYEKDNRALSHAIVGSYIARYEFNIKDNEILNAIKYHTTGKEDMTMLEKVIYMADLIEEDRSFEGVDELRDLVNKGELDKAILISLNNTIRIVIKRNQIIHPRTINARNYLVSTI